MAIEKVNKVTILLPEKDSQRFLSQLYYLNIVHIIDTFTQLDNSIIPSFQRFPTTSNDIQKLHTIFSTLKTFAPKRQKQLKEELDMIRPVKFIPFGTERVFGYLMWLYCGGI